TVCAMPNTEPAIDSPGLVAELIARGGAAGGARVLPIASITRGRKGRELADLVELAAAGAVAFSDDGAPVEDPRLFRSALEYARASDRVIIEHPQDAALSAGGLMHEGRVSADLGLVGIPAASEETAVARALWRRVADGRGDAIATDHARHASVRKEVEYDLAAFGISGLETALPLLLAGVAAGLAPLARVIAALTSGPARVLGIALEPDD